MSAWINFKELRGKLSFSNVLEHYHVETKVKGDRATTLCPLPGHPDRTDGRARTASLSVHLTRHIFHCFGCGASGNVLDFACRMEGFDPSDPVAFRAGAARVAEVFGVHAFRPVQNPRAQGGISGTQPTQGAAAKPVPAVSNPVVNAPLDFELKDLDPDHPYLKERGFSTETIRHFGLGYCNRGLMKGRVAIPLHDPGGRLVGYAGRLTKDADINEEHPKYLFPGNRERDGVRHEFRKSLLLYNAHRVIRPVSDLVVVEGFASVWWLHQHGYRNAVALMGASVSAEQTAQIDEMLGPDGRVWIFTDADPAGESCARDLFFQVGTRHFARCVRQGRVQPTDYPPAELKVLLGDAG